MILANVLIVDLSDDEWDILDKVRDGRDMIPVGSHFVLSVTSYHIVKTLIKTGYVKLLAFHPSKSYELQVVTPIPSRLVIQMANVEEAAVEAALRYFKAQVNWREQLDDREKAELRLAEMYAADFHHGTNGHLGYMLLAKLARLLDE